MNWIEEQEYLLSIDTQLEPEPLSDIQCRFIYLDHQKNIVESNNIIVPLQNKGLQKDVLSSLIHQNKQQHSLIGLCQFHIPISHHELETFMDEYNQDISGSYQNYFQEYSCVETMLFPDTLRILHSSSYVCFLFKSNYIPPPSYPQPPKSILKIKLKPNAVGTELPYHSNLSKQKKTVRFFTKNGAIKPSFQKTMKKR